MKNVSKMFEALVGGGLVLLLVFTLAGQVVAQTCSPTLLGSYDTPGQALGVYVTGSTAYVGDRFSGLQIIDFSNPASPALLGSYDTPDEALGVYVSGSTAYVADWGSGLQILDVSGCGGIQVTIDIKPGGCPNPLNVKSNGKLPVAILGTSEFNVRDIDVLSVRINGVAPVKSAFEDVAAPAFKIDQCDCEALGADFFEDLVLKFNTQEIVNSLGVVSNGDIIPLTLTGNLLESAGGTAIEGVDCVLIKGKK